METRQILASRLRQARLAAGLTQEEVRLKLGYKSLSTVSSHESLEESKNKAPRPEELYLLAKLYSVTMDWLMGLSDDPNMTRAVYLTEDELELLKSYRKASQQQRKIVKEFLTSANFTEIFQRAMGE